MFKNKLTPTANSVTVKTNPFLATGFKKSAETVSGNGAKKYDSSGNAIVDQFTKAGKYKEPRKYDDIAKDCQLLWAENPLNATKFTLFLRTIPRIVNLPDGSKTSVAQKGTELKHESIMRMIWLHLYQPTVFWNNILLFVSVGSWHDIFKMLEYDLVYNGWNKRALDWQKFGDIILAGLSNKNTSELIKKYLPQIRANSACKTIEAQANNQIAKWICSLLYGNKKEDTGWTYKKYRQLKTSGTAHNWQQLISRGRFNDIDFNSIHGRALSILVKGKFLKNQGLQDKYTAWITKPETQAKYTGFVHELFAGVGRNITAIPAARRETINKQFDTLVNKARENNVTSFIVVRDSSPSMGSIAPGTTMSCFDIAKALALFFSEFLKGKFSNAWIEFNSNAKLHEWKGKTPVEKWCNDNSSAVGSTNFQSVIDLFCKIKKDGVPESEFPTGILCISDSEFNPTALGKTNVEAARLRLKNAGFSQEYCDNFVIVLWNLQNSYYGKGSGEKFETFGDTPNVFYFGGYSGAVVSFLSEKIKSTYDLMHAALNQEVLNMVKI